MSHQHQLTAADFVAELNRFRRNPIAYVKEMEQSLQFHTIEEEDLKLLTGQHPETIDH